MTDKPQPNFIVGDPAITGIDDVNKFAALLGTYYSGLIAQNIPDDLAKALVVNYADQMVKMAVRKQEQTIGTSLADLINKAAKDVQRERMANEDSGEALHSTKPRGVQAMACAICGVTLDANTTGFVTLVAPGTKAQQYMCNEDADEYQRKHAYTVVRRAPNTRKDD